MGACIACPGVMGCDGSGDCTGSAHVARAAPPKPWDDGGSLCDPRGTDSVTRSPHTSGQPRVRTMRTRLGVCLIAAAALPAMIGCLHHHSLLCGDAAGCCGAVGCGEPVGCGSCVGGREHAFERWDCGPCDGPRICYCTGPCGGCEGPSCGCAEPACGCAEPACGCAEPACGCAEPACGCESPCGCGSAVGCCGCGLLGIFKPVGRAIGAVCGCGGCDGELYWSEWHNDPPRCTDPCDPCGNWVGPGSGPYRAPYGHECSTCQ